MVASWGGVVAGLGLGLGGGVVVGLGLGEGGRRWVVGGGR